MQLFRSMQTRALLAVFSLLALVGSQLRTTDTAQLAADPPTPRFFAWDADPYPNDDLNHFIVSVDAETVIVGDGVLVYQDDGSLAINPDHTPPASVSLSDIQGSLEGRTSIGVVAGTDIAGRIADLENVTAVESVGFGSFRVSGTITADELQAVDGVRQAAYDIPLEVASVDELYPSQWALENLGDPFPGVTGSDDADIDAPEAWHRTRGDGVVVAVIDSGVDVGHPDLAENIWFNAGETSCSNGLDDDGNGYVDDCRGWDFYANDATVDDHNGHGTHVAGIIAARGQNKIGIAGVAYDAQIMPLKIGDASPTLSAAIEAFSYAIANGADVINASWLTDDPVAESFLAPALDGARDAGILVVTGAGNDGLDLDAEPVFPASSPHDNIIVVGASTASDTAAEFSGYGAATVDVFAPGEHIVSTIPGGGYGVYSGTSMAAPMVAGAAALLWSATPAATYQEVKHALLDEADGPGRGLLAFQDLAVSDGRLNLAKAIDTPLFEPAVSYAFHDFDSFDADVLHDVTVTARTSDPWVADDASVMTYRASLLVPVDGKPAAVVGHQLTATIGNAAYAATTDTRGRAVFPGAFNVNELAALLSIGNDTPVSMQLPRGSYALIMELVDVRNPTAPVAIGEPSAVFFNVGLDGSVAEMPAEPLPDLDEDIPATTTTTRAPVDQSPPDDQCRNDDQGDNDNHQGDNDNQGDDGDGCDDQGEDNDNQGEDNDCDGIGDDDDDHHGDNDNQGEDGEGNCVEPTGTDDGGATGADDTDTAGDDSDAAAPDAAGPGDDTDGDIDHSGDVPATTTLAPTEPESAPEDGGESQVPASDPGENDEVTSTTTTLPSAVPGDGPDLPAITVGSINPDSGPTTGGTEVTIIGKDLPARPEVLFGDVAATVVVGGNDNFLVVSTNPAPPGLVAVTVRDLATGRETVLPEGFTYEGDDPVVATTTTTTTTTLPPEAPAPVPEDDATDQDPPDGRAPASEIELRADHAIDAWLDQVLVTPDGLDLAPLPDDDPFSHISMTTWAGQLCEQRSCPGWMVREGPYR